MSALLANKLDEVSRQIADQKPTGNAELDKTLGNLVANVMSTVVGGVVGGAQGAQAAYNVDRFNRQLHQDANPRKDERKRIEQDIAPAYAAAHAGMTVEEATDILAAQLLRQVDTTAASQGGWDQDASNYLNAYAATHPGETIGKDQWGNAVPLFGTASGYQRNDSTIFSAAPQTTNPPPQLGLGAVGGYLAGMGQGLADTIGHPLDTLWGGVKGAYGLITDPQGTAQQMQEATRNVIIQAGGGNYAPAGQQVGQQLGSTVVGTTTGVTFNFAVSKAAGAINNIRSANAVAAETKKFTDAARAEGNFYRDGSIVDIGEHFGRFADGASLLTPVESFGKYSMMGRPDGWFVSTPNYIASLLRKTGGDNALIKQRLGIEPEYWNGPLFRVDIPNPLENNPRLPTGLEAGANSHFTRGGYTAGGAPEITIDPIPIKQVKPMPVVRPPQ
ncbi:hypothetical protein [Mycetohabitans sp. B5]|uniref:hypothetical protein n=1 Tax=Mycetohabitans sp. B5 TaxID=2841846 RepID=UPI001F198ABD|nr:hypothetical protein [Mycetohabitans sp. B5]